MNRQTFELMPYSLIPVALCFMFHTINNALPRRVNTNPPMREHYLQHISSIYLECFLTQL